MYEPESEDYDNAIDQNARTNAPIAKKPRKGQNLEEEEYFSRPKVPIYEERFNACDKMSTLYVLQQELFIKGHGFTSEVPTKSSR